MALLVGLLLLLGCSLLGLLAGLLLGLLLLAARLGELFLLLLDRLLTLLGGTLLVGLELVLGRDALLAGIGVELACLRQQRRPLLELGAAGADLVVTQKTAGELVGAAEGPLDEQSPRVVLREAGHR